MRSFYSMIGITITKAVGKLRFESPAILKVHEPKWASLFDVELKKFLNGETNKFQKISEDRYRLPANALI